MSETRSVRLDWMGEGLRFRGGGTDPATPSVEVDGDGGTGPSPMLTLLLACAGCSGSDVVLILQKMRARLKSLSIDVRGVRGREDPKRYTAILFRYRMSADGVSREQAERAVTLSLEKYCSVVHSLAPDIAVDYEIEFV